jgi:5-formyltetrahydrofolate cyclo-ligase
MRIQKKLVREEILNKRTLLTEQEAREKSKAIFGKLMNLPEFVESEVIFCFIDFRNEVQTRSFIKSCISIGKRVSVPLVVKDNKLNEMWACEIANLENLSASSYGILEPIPGKFVKLKPSDIDFIVVPGSVFDIQRHRIGYGAGYYDVFLKQTRKDCHKFAVAFDLQVVENVPVEQHDIAMDKIITESRII